MDITESKNIIVRNIKIFTDNFMVFKDDKEIHFTPHEYELLKFLMIHAGKSLSRESILSYVWAYNEDIETRVVDQNIQLLVKKLGKGYIQTHRGVGYRFIK